MTFVSEMVDELRLLLNDPTDTQVPILTKRLYLNRGVSRLWPKIWRARVEVQAVVSGVREYPLSFAGGASDGFVLSVEIQQTSGSYQRYNDYDILSGDEELAGALLLTGALPSVGTNIRVRYASQIASVVGASYAAMSAEAWIGLDRAIKLPVLYAMGMISLSKVDDRQDALRYSTTQATNGVTDNDLMSTAQMWFGQFEQELDDMALPMPVARD